MIRGYVKIWRKIRDSFVWQDSDCLKLFLHLIMEANHKDTEFIFNNKKTTLLRGQLICGRHSLERDLGINESKIYRLLTLLENEHLIEQQKTNLYTIVSIVCYNDYQSNEQQIEQPVNNQRTSSEHPVNTSKELIRTNKNIFVPPTLDEVTNYCIERGNKGSPEGFIDFYSSKGWKVGKEPMKDWKAAFRRSEKWESNNKKSLVMEGF